MSTYPYIYTQTYSYSSILAVLLPILAIILVIGGGFALYFLFVRRPNTYRGAAAKLHDFLSFRTFFLEKILHLLYCITVVGIVIYSILLLFSHFFLAIFLFIGGNIAARLSFEVSLLLVTLCRNTAEINRKMAPLPKDEPQQAPVQPQPPVYQQPPAAPVNPGQQAEPDRAEEEK